jgi:hypothetical protein
MIKKPLYIMEDDDELDYRTLSTHPMTTIELWAGSKSEYMKIFEEARLHGSVRVMRFEISNLKPWKTGL